MSDRKRRVVSWYHRRVANPLTRRMPGQVVLETVGRRSGRARLTPVGGRRVGDSFWMVSDHGYESQYVRNIVADPRIRVKLGGEWLAGIAVPLPDDDARRRLRSLPRVNSMMVRSLGTDLLTIRIDLDPDAHG